MDGLRQGVTLRNTRAETGTGYMDDAGEKDGIPRYLPEVEDQIGLWVSLPAAALLESRGTSAGWLHRRLTCGAQRISSESARGSGWPKIEFHWILCPVMA